MFLFVSLQKLLNVYVKEKDKEAIARAYLLAAENALGHAPATVMVNLMAVSCILSSIKVDKDVIIACFLHHTRSKNNSFKNTIEHKYGADVVNIMREIQQLDNMKTTHIHPIIFVKLIRNMVKDRRALFIKLAEKMHSVRIISSLDPQQQTSLAQEALNIWVPLAKQLGITEYRRDLEIIAFKILYPYRYRILKDAMHEYTEKHKTTFQNTMKMLCKQVRHAIQNTDDVIGRKKSLYSIYQKMCRKNVSFLQITDLYAYKIIVKLKQECYIILGLVHELFKPMHRKFKDFIGFPKSNGYQALHTTLFGPYGITIEIQIKTHEMNHRAEYGSESHYLYKAHNANHSQGIAQDSQNISQTLAYLKNNLDSGVTLAPTSPPVIYVYTAQEDIKEMPFNSSCLDFAFALHTEIGNTCTSAIVNGRRQPLGYKLKNGDLVKIITADTPQVHEKWLDLVTTKKAKKCIYTVLRKNAPHLQTLGHVSMQAPKTIFYLTEEHMPFLERCCKPIKGDKVTLIQGNPIQIHRCGCKQVLGVAHHFDEIMWSTKPHTTFKSALYIQLDKTRKATTDIMHLFTAHAIPIVNFNPVVGTHCLIIEVCIAITEVSILNIFMNHLRKSSKCINISRYPIQE